MVLIIFPGLMFCALSGIFYSICRQRRPAILLSVLAMSVLAVVMVELLSFLTLLQPWALKAGWLILTLGTIGLFWRPMSEGLAGLLKLNSPILFREKILIGIVLVFGLLAGLAAFGCAPNNWDSMTYHLPRVEHWMQNHSVDHYPTHILRQLYQPPGAEFWLLQIQLLTGTDRWVGGLQWLSWGMVVSVISLIAKELGASRWGQGLTMILGLTLPMAILQASSTQNDLVASLWYAAFIYFVIRLMKGDEALESTIACGLSLGLAWLTKGTMYVLVMPWLVGLLYRCLRSGKKGMLKILSILILALVLNAGHYIRNVAVFGSPLASGQENYVTQGGVVGKILINPLLNASLHFSSPYPAWNAFWSEAIKGIHERVLNQPFENLCWDDFKIPDWGSLEDTAGNPLHFILGLLAFGYFMITQKQHRAVFGYGLAVVLAGLLFCFIFKWQLFHSRLHLPLFLVVTPVVAFALERIGNMKAITGVIVVLVVLSLPPLFYNERRPLIGEHSILKTGRIEQMFRYRKFMTVPYVLSAKYAAQKADRSVGLILGSDDWEYPLWVLLKRFHPQITVAHVDVHNASQFTREDVLAPQVIISEKEDQREVIEIAGRTYRHTQSFIFMKIYE